MDINSRVQKANNKIGAIDEANKDETLHGNGETNYVNVYEIQPQRIEDTYKNSEQN